MGLYLAPPGLESRVSLDPRGSVPTSRDLPLATLLRTFGAHIFGCGRSRAV